MDSEQLLVDLTPEQREAATHVDGPLLIVAGAGSGKTRVITRRVAYLMSLGIPAPAILAITFTNKAAGEMKARISSQLDRPLRDWGRLDQPWSIICTFHSLCLRILKHYATRVGLPPNFSIYDSSDQERLIKEAIKTADLSTSNFPAGRMHAAISEAKNKLQTAHAYTEAQTDFLGRSIAKVYRAYEKLLVQNNALDFDDLLMRTAHAFRDHADVLAELQERFSYLLIDEYQDTNHAQYIIAHLLAQKHRNICVVGDPDQSIYAWRGADIRNILDFEQDYPDAKVIHLERNYRSTQTILKIASQLIENNRERKKKTLWTENPAGDTATVLLCDDEHAEAAAVAARLKEQHEKHGLEYSKMAVFYRMNSLSRVMEDALRKLRLPYRIARGVDFYHRKEIKDVLAYLRIIVNSSDEISLMRIANVPARGISDATLKQVQARAMGAGVGLWAGMNTAGLSDLPARAQGAMAKFVEMVVRWQAMMQRLGESRGGFSRRESNPDAGPAAEAAPTGASADKGRVQTIMEEVVKSSGYETSLRKAGNEDVGESAMANVNELISSAAEYDEENPEGSLEDYLARISLVSDVDTLKEAGGAITLMTLHAAKGLEFPVVAMIGLEEGCLPHARVREHPEQLEEERRLCFVGITRAQQKLILSRAAYRTVRGLRERQASSRFLGEMPQDALSILEASGRRASAADFSAQRGFGEAGFGRSQFRQGQLVKHPRFGLGRIAEISGMGPSARAIVVFNEAGRKTLVLDAAPLEVVR